MAAEPSTHPAAPAAPRGALNGHLRADVQELFVGALSTAVPSDDTDLIEGGYLDSLALVELLVEIEQRFAVALPLDDLEIDDFRTIRRIGEVIAAGARAGE